MTVSGKTRRTKKLVNFFVLFLLSTCCCVVVVVDAVDVVVDVQATQAKKWTKNVYVIIVMLKIAQTQTQTQFSSFCSLEQKKFDSNFKRPSLFAAFPSIIHGFFYSIERKN